MSVVIKSAGHFFAAGFHDFMVAARAVAMVNNKIQSQEGTIESITALVPVYGPEAALVERLAFAVLGEIAALVQTCGTAQLAAQKAPDIDPAVLAQVEALLKQNPQFVEQALKLNVPNA